MLFQRSVAKFANLTPVERRGLPSMMMGSRFGLPIDLDDGEKLPFPVACEILFEVGFAPRFTIDVYYQLSN